jgi:Spy/CpxP family protein refolding chaperone
MTLPMRALALVALLALPAAAQPIGGPPPDGGPGRGGPPRFMSQLYPPTMVMQSQDEIGLSDVQRDRIKAAMVDAERELTDDRWALEAETEKVSKLLEQPQVDQAAVLAQMDRVLAAESKLKKRHFALLLAIRDALTPAQRAKLDGMRRRDRPGPPPMPPE